MNCSIEGCQSKTRARGLCGKHLYRLDTYGDPHHKVTSRGEAAEWFIDSLSLETQDCIVWPFSNVRGYAVRQKGKKLVRVCREVCEIENGPPPAVDLQAAHSCGNRMCVNRKHLRWATAQENSDDKAIHGTQTRGSDVAVSKLKEEDVKVIRERLSQGKTLTEMAQIYSVSIPTIARVRDFATWRHVEAA